MGMNNPLCSNANSGVGGQASGQEQVLVPQGTLAEEVTGDSTREQRRRL